MNYTLIDEDIQILYQDERIVGIYKPSGYHVHQHQDTEYPVPRSHICLYQVRDRIGKYIYPVHRLDAPTSGVMLFALDSEAARLLANEFQHQRVRKYYELVVRGWLKEKLGKIELPLELDSTQELVPACTDYEVVHQIELPHAVGKKHLSARYSYVKASPKTGRYHQIRRHFQRLNHPVVGDTRHGDSHHNRFFRTSLGVQGLCLRSQKLEIKLPWSGQDLTLQSPQSEKWLKILQLFQPPAT